MSVTRSQIDCEVREAKESIARYSEERYAPVYRRVLVELYDQRNELVDLLSLAGTQCTAYNDGDIRQPDCMCHGCTRRKYLARIGAKL